MFGHVYKRLTELSFHYIDWSRFGELLGSNNHRYSREELQIRGAIAGTTVIAGTLGCYFNNEKKTGCSTLTFTLLTAFLGFAGSHIIAIVPLLQKRHQMRNDCEAKVREIQFLLEQKQSQITPELLETIRKLMHHFRTLSLSDNKHGNASLTWGTRRALLYGMYEKLLDSEIDVAFWLQDKEVIQSKLAVTAPPPPLLKM